MHYYLVIENGRRARSTTGGRRQILNLLSRRGPDRRPPCMITRARVYTKNRFFVVCSGMRTREHLREGPRRARGGKSGTGTTTEPVRRGGPRRGWLTARRRRRRAHTHLSYAGAVDFGFSPLPSPIRVAPAAPLCNTVLPPTCCTRRARRVRVFFDLNPFRSIPGAVYPLASVPPRTPFSAVPLFFVFFFLFLFFFVFSKKGLVRNVCRARSSIVCWLHWCCWLARHFRHRRL